MRTFFEFWAQYLIWSPTATKLQPVGIEDIIDIDALSIEKWSPMVTEINGAVENQWGQSVSSNRRKYGTCVKTPFFGKATFKL